MNAVVERVCKLIFGGLAQKVWPAKRADKDKVASKKCKRLPAPRLLVDKKTQVLRRVARSVNRYDSEVPYLKLFPILELSMFELVFEILTCIVPAQPKLSTCSFTEGRCSGGVIGMDMGFKDVGNLKPVCLASTTFSGWRQLFLSIDDNYSFDITSSSSTLMLTGAEDKALQGCTLSADSGARPGGAG